MANETVQGIVSGIVNKSTGTPPVTNDVNTDKTGATSKDTVTAVDPNAGKEKYVVDGKEHYLTPEQAKAYVQKGLAFEPKVSELDRLQKETSQFLQTLREDPAKILLNPKFGDSPEGVLKKILASTKVSDPIKDALGQWYYENIITQERMTPEQREAAEWKRKATEYDSYREQQEAQRVQQENNARIQSALGVLKSQIGEALKEGGLDVNSKVAPQMASRIAKVILLANKLGKPLTPKQAYETARKELREYKTAFYDSLDEDKLVEELGKENAEKVRKHFLKKLQEKDSKSVKASSTGPTAKREERKTMNSDEFREYLEDLKRKGK